VRGTAQHLAVNSDTQFHDNFSGIAKQAGFLAVILNHPDQSFPCKSCYFLNCTLLELYGLSFSLMFEESGLTSSQIFLSLPIYRHLPANHCFVYLTKLFMTTVNETQLQKPREKVRI